MPTDTERERAAFLRRILAVPADVTGRLVFADWLDEHGEREQAGFIRAQIEMARMMDEGDVAHELSPSKRAVRAAPDGVTVDALDASHGWECSDACRGCRYMRLNQRTHELLERNRQWVPESLAYHPVIYGAPAIDKWGPFHGAYTRMRLVPQSQDTETRRVRFAFRCGFLETIELVYGELTRFLSSFVCKSPRTHKWCENGRIRVNQHGVRRCHRCEGRGHILTFPLRRVILHADSDELASFVANFGARLNNRVHVTEPIGATLTMMPDVAFQIILPRVGD